MAAVVNDRDLTLEAQDPRVLPVILPPNVSIPTNQVLRINITTTDAFWRVDKAGVPVNTSLTLTAVLPTSFTAQYVTWSKTGTNSVPPAAGTTNSWTLYAADQLDDTAYYTATIVNEGISYSTSFTLTRIRDGLEGERGQTGAAGTLTGYGKAFGIISNSWSDDVAARVIYNMLTNETATSGITQRDHLLLGDTVILSNNSSYSESKFWTGFAWEAVGMVLDGNLLVNGTVSATKITAGDIMTGQNANATISIGNTTFIGSIKSPLHVTKSSAQSGQALITALNAKDDSVAIWGASAGAVNGNAVAGTWHNTEADVNATRWQLIGLLGSDLYGGAVAGVAYGQDRGGAFYFYDGTSNAAPGSLKHSVGLATDTHAVVLGGPIELTGTASPLRLAGDDGTVGYVMTSNGPGLTPEWKAVATGTSVTFSNVNAALAAANEAVTVPANIRSTAILAPTSGEGLELAYGNAGAGNSGYLVSAARSGGTTTFKPLTFSASAYSFDSNGTANFANVPTVTASPATSDNTTKLASTAYVVARIAQDAPTKTGTGASGSWGISVTGNAATATKLASAVTINGVSFDGSGNITIPSGAPTSAQVQTALAGVSSATSVSSTLRATALTPPASGVGLELGYGTNGTTRSWILSYDRSGGAYQPLTLMASSFSFEQGTANFVNAPTMTTTPATSTNSTTIATTAYVVSRISQDAPTKTGSGASGTWSISISGNAATATSASSASSATTAGSCSGNAATATSASTVNGWKTCAGSGTTNGSGDVTFSFPFSFSNTTELGISALSGDTVFCQITGISTSSVTIRTRFFNGTIATGQSVRFVATGK